MSGFELHNPQIDPFALDNDGNYLLRLYDDGVELAFGSGEISIDLSNPWILNLVNRPVGALGITGMSVHGETVEEFFNFCAKSLLEDIPELDEVCDFTYAAEAASHKISLYITSETTILELAENVSKAINYFFWIMPYYDKATATVRKRIVVIDINLSLFSDLAHSTGVNPLTNENILKYKFDDKDLIKTEISYPYPVKALETDLETNEVYTVEADEDRSSSMKPRTVTIRLDSVHNFGNVESKDTFAQTRSEARMWLQRFKDISSIPTVSAVIRGIYSLDQLKLGDKVLVVDNVRNVQYKILIQDLSYDFNLSQTVFKGLSLISKISYD